MPSYFAASIIVLTVNVCIVKQRERKQKVFLSSINGEKAAFSSSMILPGDNLILIHFFICSETAIPEQ